MTYYVSGYEILNSYIQVDSAILRQLSTFTSDHARYPMFNYFFGLSWYLTKNTACLNCENQRSTDIKMPVGLRVKCPLYPPGQISVERHI
jgi:hypothetical protein